MEFERKAALEHGVVLVEPVLADRVRAFTVTSSTNCDSDGEAYFGHGRDTDDMAIMGSFDHFDRKSSQQSIASPPMTGTVRRYKYRVLGTLCLVSVTFFASGGGPIGCERVISAGGPLVGLVGVIVYVLACVFPLSLVVTELSCAFPENSGYSVWATTAFGPFWGFQVGFWSWVAFVTNNAIYPGLIYNTVVDGNGIEATSAAVAFFVKFVLAIVLALPSFVGARVVGITSLILMALVCITTLVFTAWGFMDGNGSWFRLAEIRGPSDVVEDSPVAGIDWPLLTRAIFWTFDGLYDISVIGGEVFNPARTLPRVISAAVAITVLTCLVPLISAVTADKIAWVNYVDDSYPLIARAIGGSLLNHVIVGASVLSSVGMFTCTLFLQSYLLQGMAQARLIPSLLRKRSTRFKTPQNAILFSLVVTLVLIAFDLDFILDMTNAFSGAVQISILISMLKLRWSFPHLPRPMRVPGNVMTISVMALPSAWVFVIVIVTALEQTSLAFIIVGFILVGLVFPIVRGRLASRVRWCK